jgi:lysozyme
MTPDLFERTVAREGLKLKPYRDTRGNWTIGIGHNMEVDPAMMARLAELQEHGITEDEARSLFLTDTLKFTHQLDVHFAWWLDLDDVRQDVIFDMAFNMGLETFATFHHTLGDIQAHRWPAAAADMLASKWAEQTGRRARADAEEMEIGEECSLS